MMNFSVLISVYHREKAEYLRTALDSVTTAQTLRPDQVVLVKDGPLTQELDAVIDEFAAKNPGIVEVVTLPVNQGLGSALNEGLKHCRHDLVARMDSDDIALPERFERQLNIFATHPEFSVVGSWIDEFEQNPEHIISQRKLPQFPEELARYCRTRSPMNHPGVMFRRRDILAVGGYQSFPLFEDYYLWARLVLSNYKLYNIQKSLLLYRTSPGTIERRGGWKHACDEVRLMWLLRQKGLFGWGTWLKNILIRFPVRVMPAKLRTFVYWKLLR